MAAALLVEPRTFDQKQQRVAKQLGVCDTCLAAKLQYMITLCILELLDNGPGRMILVSELDGGAYQFAIAVVSTEMIGDPADPIPELRQTVAGVRFLEFPPVSIHLHSRPPEALDDEVVLRAEMAIKRHLVAVGSVDDGIDANAPDTMLAEQSAGSIDNAITRGAT